MGYQHLTVDTHPTQNGEVVTITLARPERRNCLSTEVLVELDTALRSSGSNTDVAGVVLASTGNVFSSGHDLSEMATMTEDEFRELFTVCTRTMNALAEVPQVVIASVQGLATAAGAQLAASCDLVVASDQASFATPGGKGGLFCHTPMVAVARQIGRKRAAEIALTGGTIDAETALDWGLINRVAPHDQLAEATMELMTYATRGSRFGKGLGKRALYAQMDMPTADAYDYAIEVMSTAAAVGDGAEGIASFVEKRDPRWSHTS